MGYKRKTVDVWRLYVNYGQGWEHEVTNYSRAESNEDSRAYCENQPYPIKIVRGRESVECNI